MGPWTEDDVMQRYRELAADPAPGLFAQMLESALVLQALQAPTEWRAELFGLACELQSLGMPPRADAPALQAERARAVDGIRTRYMAFCALHKCSPDVRNDPQTAALVASAESLLRKAVTGLRGELERLAAELGLAEDAMLSGDMAAAERYLGLMGEERSLEDRVLETQFVGP